jgi:hypothetical protein
MMILVDESLPEVVLSQVCKLITVTLFVCCFPRFPCLFSVELNLVASFCRIPVLYLHYEGRGKLTKKFFTCLDIHSI